MENNNSMEIELDTENEDINNNITQDKQVNADQLLEERYKAVTRNQKNMKKSKNGYQI